jgi:hypothetical protein
MASEECSMSKDDSGNVEAAGIPGYSANNTIPGGFSLPLPTVTNSGEPETEAEQSADPWSSTWDDSSWQLPEAESDASLYASEEVPGYSSASYTSSDGGSADDWSDSYDHGGDPEAATPGAVPASSGWEPWEPAAATGFDPDTGHWSELQHNAETDARSTEEYSGWVPAGAPDVPTNGLHYGADHSRAAQAYAAAPPVDPDVAAAAAELGQDLSPAAYDTTTAARTGTDRPSAEDLITVRSQGGAPEEQGELRAAQGLRHGPRPQGAPRA